MPRNPQAFGGILAFGVLALAALPAPTAAQIPLNGSEVALPATSHASAALLAAERGAWADASLLAYQAADPVVVKLVFWLKAMAPQSELSFAELAEFLGANPDWPNQVALRRRAEEALTDGYAPDLIAGWFDRFPPLTTNGRVRRAAALSALGLTAQLETAVRDAWLNGSFTEADEAQFLASYGHLLAAEDHARRVDRLLWDNNVGEAQRLLDRLAAGDRAVAEARIRIKRKQATPERAAALVPAARRNDAGLVFDEVQWYRRNGQPMAARLRLMQLSGDPAEPGRLWSERAILSRQAMSEGDALSAYRLAAGHGLREGSDLVEAEWFAGWVALRNLSDPATAARHFDRLAEAAQMPISQARGAYWAGRARDAAGNGAEAQSWYERAAQFPTTYYGQLAAANRAPGQPLPLPPDPVASAEDRDAFERHELKRAADLLAAAGLHERFRAFVVKLSEVLPTAGSKALAADYALAAGRHDVSVAVAKQAVRGGQLLVSGGYPMLSWLDSGGEYAIETPLVLSLIRQESQFNPAAVSPAGARGLMQLMPATAREVAGKLGLPFAVESLTVNPAYNLQLGQAYLGRLLNSFSGSYVYSLAGYNAGPGRVRQWVGEFGDARGDLLAMIDWVERIPFSETRNYVQRTIEGLHVYRNRLGGPQTPLLIDQDLVR